MLKVIKLKNSRQTFVAKNIHFLWRKSCLKFRQNWRIKILWYLLVSRNFDFALIRCVNNAYLQKIPRVFYFIFAKRKKNFYVPRRFRSFRPRMISRLKLVLHFYYYSFIFRCIYIYNITLTSVFSHSGSVQHIGVDANEMQFFFGIALLFRLFSFL